VTSAVDPTIGGSLTGSGEIYAKTGDGTTSLQEQLAIIASEISAAQLALASLTLTSVSGFPNTYLTYGQQIPQVNSAENALEFVHHVGDQTPGRDAIGDASLTIAVPSSPNAKHMQEWATTLTANRTCALPTANLGTGKSYIIKRSAGGAFYLRVTNLGAGAASTFDLYQNEALYVEYDGSQWNAYFAYTTRAIDMRDSLLNRALIGSYTEKEASVTPSAGTVTLDCDTYQVFDISLTGNVSTIALTNVDASAHTSFLAYFVQDVVGGRTVAWTVTINGNAATVKWGGGVAATVSSAANAVDKYLFSIRSASLTVCYVEFVQAYA
jgi:hypothetical protein